MQIKVEGNEIVVKKLFGEKRYSFRELTRVDFRNGMNIYIEDKCIFQEKNLLKILDVLEKIKQLALDNQLIVEYKSYFPDEIAMQDVYSYGKQVCEKLQMPLQEYVEQELGQGYELVISKRETPYKIVLYFDIYANGEKVCMDDVEEVACFTDNADGKKEYHLTWFEIVEPAYVNPKKQEYKLTKLVNFEDYISEIKEEIQMMKERGIVPVSKFIH